MEFFSESDWLQRECWPESDEGQSDEPQRELPESDEPECDEPLTELDEKFGTQESLLNLEEEYEEEQGETLCGVCGDVYASDEFWIGCDICLKWFYGKCVQITPARAEHMKRYKCSACNNNRARQQH